MPDDRKRTYQSVTPLPSLRIHIAVPPLKMVLVGEQHEDAGDEMSGGTGKSKPASGVNTPATKERIVRKIIEHLEKEP